MHPWHDYFKHLDPQPLTKEEEYLSRQLLELRHLLETGRLNADTLRDRLRALIAPPFPPKLQNQN